MYKIYRNNSKSFLRTKYIVQKNGVIFYYYYYSDTKMYTAHTVYILCNIIHTAILHSILLYVYKYKYIYNIYILYSMSICMYSVYIICVCV